MATVEKWVPADVEDVWAVLADPCGYAFWVVGSHDVRGVEGEWPQPGARFHHTQGHGPVKLKDDSVVISAEPQHRLELEVRARPFVIAKVVLELRADKDGTCITISEKVTGGLLGVAPDFVNAPFLALRNADSLRRLAAMAWTRKRVRQG